MRAGVSSILFAMALQATPAFAFRCGNHLVVEGDTRAAVRAKCGEPTDISRRSVLRPPIVWRYGRPMRVGHDDIEVEIENWLYNLGTNRFMRRLRFEDGIVVEIETLGYGYNEH